MADADAGAIAQAAKGGGGSPAATMAAWDTAAFRAPDAIVMTGATGPNAPVVNGAYDRVPAERKPGGASVFKRRAKTAAGEQLWLFLAHNSKWTVANT